MSDLDDKLESLRTRVVRVIREHTGLHEHLARPIAAEIIATFWQEVAGERVYVPARDPALPDKVRSEFNGCNRTELMKKYEISRSTFYAYIRRERSVPTLRPGSPTRDEFSF